MHLRLAVHFLLLACVASGQATQGERKRRHESAGSNKTEAKCAQSEPKCQELETAKLAVKATNISTTRAASSAPSSGPSQNYRDSGLITKTADAIYRALSQVFTYEDNGDETLRPAGSAPSKKETAPTTLAPTTERPTVTPSSPSATPLMVTNATTIASTNATQQQLVSTAAPIVEVKPANATKPPTRQLQSSNKTSNGTGEADGSPLYQLLGQALSSIYQLGFLSRPTRLAPERELAATLDSRAEKLTLAGEPIQAPSSSEEVHLLCRLLHQHLEERERAANNQTTGASPKLANNQTAAVVTPSTLPTNATSRPQAQTTAETSTTTTQRSTTSSGSQAKVAHQETTQSEAQSSTLAPPGVHHSRLFVHDPSELNEQLHAGWLLESEFRYDRKQRSSTLVERAAELMLMELVEKAAARRRAQSADDYDEDEDENNNNNNNNKLPLANRNTSSGGLQGVTTTATGAEVNPEDKFTMRVAERLTRSSHGALSLVYWLLEPAPPAFLPQKPASLEALDSSPPLSSHRNAARHNLWREYAEKQKHRFRVLNEHDANELLDQLEHSLIRRHLEAAKLSSMGPLVHAYTVDLSQEHSDGIKPPPTPPHRHRHKHKELEAHVIDDSLGPAPPGGARGLQLNKTTTSHTKQESSNGTLSQPAAHSSLQLLWDKLTSASFVDNLQLYLIIFILVLVAIILCFACPMFCFGGSQASGSTAALTPNSSGGVRRGRPRAARQQGATTNQPAHLNAPPTLSLGLKGAGKPVELGGRGPELALTAGDELEDSVWRKLSSTTTTLMRDESLTSRVLHNAEADALTREQQEGVAAAGGKESSQAAWCSFEDRVERQLEELRRAEQRLLGAAEARRSQQPKQTSYYISDRRQISKSVQTFEEPNARRSGESPVQLLDLKERQEKRSSDTLTKSELVLLKEKLVPIAQPQSQQPAYSCQMAPPSCEAPAYANLALAGSNEACQTGGSLEEEQSIRQRPLGLGASTARFIDSSGSRSDSSGERTNTVIELAPAERSPTMRHLDLPPRTRTKLDAIKTELGKIEQRDPLPSSTARALSPDAESTFKRRSAAETEQLGSRHYNAK